MQLEPFITLIASPVEVISKKRINLLELQWWSFITIFFFLSFFQHFISSLDDRGYVDDSISRDRTHVNNRSFENVYLIREINFGSTRKFEMFIHVYRYSAIIIMLFNKKYIYIYINETWIFEGSKRKHEHDKYTSMLLWIILQLQSTKIELEITRAGIQIAIGSFGSFIIWRI